MEAHKQHLPVAQWHHRQLSNVCVVFVNSMRAKETEKHASELGKKSCNLPRSAAGGVVYEYSEYCV